MGTLVNAIITEANKRLVRAPALCHYQDGGLIAKYSAARDTDWRWPLSANGETQAGRPEQNNYSSAASTNVVQGPTVQKCIAHLVGSPRRESAKRSRLY